MEQREAVASKIAEKVQMISTNNLVVEHWSLPIQNIPPLHPVLLVRLKRPDLSGTETR